MSVLDKIIEKVKTYEGEFKDKVREGKSSRFKLPEIFYPGHPEVTKSLVIKERCFDASIDDIHIAVTMEYVELKEMITTMIDTLSDERHPYRVHETVLRHEETPIDYRLEIKIRGLPQDEHRLYSARDGEDVREKIKGLYDCIAKKHPREEDIPVGTLDKKLDVELLKWAEG